jgi:hypothetical protein
VLPEERYAITQGGETRLQLRQKAYLTFLVPTKHNDLPPDKLLKLIDALLARGDLVVTTHSAFDKYPIGQKREIWRQNQIPLLCNAGEHTTDCGRLYYFRRSDAPAPPEPYWVTKTRIALGETPMESVVWEGRTELQPTTIRDLEDMESRLQGIDYKAVRNLRPVFVSLTTKE